MSRTKRDPKAKDEMLRLAVEWQRFRTDNGLTQKILAELIKVSRRTIQSVEAGIIIPQKATIDAFEKLRSTYEREGKSGGRNRKEAA